MVSPGRYWSMKQQTDPDERYGGNVSNQGQGEQVKHNERYYPPIDGLESDSEHRLGDENVDAERRMKQANRQIDHENDAKMDCVDAERFRHRNQQGCEQQNCRQWIEKAANNQKKYIDHEQKLPGRDVKIFDPGHKRGRHLIDG